MKASRLSVSILSVFFAGLSLIIVEPAEAELTSVVISDDVTGGDCSRVGKWDASSKTCTLTEDIDLGSDGGDGIEITSDGITFQCDGHSITGNGDGSGIVVSGRSGVTIKSCMVQNFYYGICLYDSSTSTMRDNATGWNYVGILLYNSTSSTVNNNTAYSNDYGICLYFSNDNTANNNTADNNAYFGIHIHRSDANSVNNNTAAYNYFAGIYLQGSESNTLNHNTASYNDWYGFYNHLGTFNTFKHNECSGNGLQVSFPAGLCRH